MVDYKTWYIFYVSKCASACYYYASTANPGPEGGRVICTMDNGAEAILYAEKRNRGMWNV
jgi:hypothetical protein